MPVRQAIIKQVSGLTLIGKSDTNHWIVMDGPPELGGHNAGSRPKELLLMALGGCTASDVILILKKKRATYDDIEVHLTANVREEHPQVFTDIHIEYIVYGVGINPKDVERAIELSQSKYCSVTAMLRASVNITHSYKILPSRQELEQREITAEN